MKIILPMAKDILNIWKKQRYVEEYEYKNIIYLKSLLVEEGVLLYNLLTNEMIIITENEYNHILNNTLKNENKLLYKFLVTHWFMIPKDYDEKTMVYMGRNIIQEKSLMNNECNSFTILTTTDCNARCFYCYELGVRRLTMTEQTAIDAAEYIVSRANKSKCVYLSWFGGEPLFNHKVIDIICTYLEEHGFTYRSSMISNSYLFDDELITKAVDLWHLERVQVTLDGTKEIYNKTKAYIYKDNSAFDRVIDNVDKLLNANIRVSIRYNLTENNKDDLYKLTDLLYDRFHSTNGKFNINVATLFEDIENNLLVRTDKQREYIYNELFKLEDYIIDKGLYIKPTIKNQSIVIKQCMADSPSSCIITPEGNLGVCEHYVDSKFFGSIYDDTSKRDYSNLRCWKKLAPEIEECKSCFYYPKCVRLAGCHASFMCHEMKRKQNTRKVEWSMMNSFENYKKRNADTIAKYVKLNRG